MLLWPFFCLFELPVLLLSAEKKSCIQVIHYIYSEGYQRGTDYTFLAQVNPYLEAVAGFADFCFSRKLFYLTYNPK